MLVRGLPLESRTARTLGAHKPGDLTAYELLSLDLEAIAAEILSGANWLFIKAHVKKGTHVPDPLKIPRVWRETGEDTKRQSTPEEVAAFFGSRIQVRYTPKEG